MVKPASSRKRTSLLGCLCSYQILLKFLVLPILFGFVYLWFRSGIAVVIHSSSLLSQEDVIVPEIVLLSTPEHTHVETDVRGNLGPANVLLDINGTDWLKDRWQAASDMHGTAIKGTHWVQLEFDTPIAAITKVILDWETAYSDDYILEGRITKNDIQPTVILFDTRNIDYVQKYRTEQTVGQSPGVKQKLPLHVIHTWNIINNTTTSQLQHQIQHLKLYIRKPFHSGWGVSLWKIEIYGYYYFT